MDLLCIQEADAFVMCTLNIELTSFIWKWIFINSYEEPVHDQTFYMMLKRVQLQAKLVDEDGDPKISLHGLRHTHATILLNNGQNVKVIAERIGNTPNMVMNTYGHVMKELEQESVTVFSASLATGANS